MRKYRFALLIMLYSFILFSCQNDNLHDLKNDKNYIAKIENKKVEFIVDKSTVKRNWEKELQPEFDFDVKFDKIKIINIEGRYYLRGYGKDFVSTRMFIEHGNMLMLRGTTCTTKACASSSTACMPQDDGSCSSCWLGDCVRSTSDDDVDK